MPFLPRCSLWVLPWSWENDATASNMLGIPVAQTLSVDLVETALVTKLQSRITKLNKRHLALAARIVTANSLLLGCVWYMHTVWAGKRNFLSKLQKMIDTFVWAGRSPVKRTTTALPRAEGGLSLISVETQYRALTCNFMLWIMREGQHPLRQILGEHIMQASWRRWGLRDLSWLVSKCGHLRIEGSASWLNLCKNWEILKTCDHRLSSLCRGVERVADLAAAQPV